MQCTSPIRGWRGPGGTVSFSRRGASHLSAIYVPCGQCIDCRISRSRDWATRCMHEASLHPENCFLTLTYDDEHLPTHQTLVKKHIKDFIKRLRQALRRKLCDCNTVKCEDDSHKFRYFHCGEYGDKKKRPHYHMIVFGQSFKDDRRWVDKTDSGHDLYESDFLKKRWKFGRHWFGEVSYESCAYVARYALKKVTGEAAHRHYNDFDRQTGEVFSEREPEYTTMSLKPAIGSGWIQKHWKETYRNDFVIMNGAQIAVPQYYDRWMEKHHPEVIARVKRKRNARGKKKQWHQDAMQPQHDRLHAKAENTKSRLSRLDRKLD